MFIYKIVLSFFLIWLVDVWCRFLETSSERFQGGVASSTSTVGLEEDNLHRVYWCNYPDTDLMDAGNTVQVMTD